MAPSILPILSDRLVAVRLQTNACVSVTSSKDVLSSTFMTEIHQSHSDQVQVLENEIYVLRTALTDSKTKEKIAFDQLQELKRLHTNTNTRFHHKHFCI